MSPGKSKTMTLKGLKRKSWKVKIWSDERGIQSRMRTINGKWWKDATQRKIESFTRLGPPISPPESPYFPFVTKPGLACAPPPSSCGPKSPPISLQIAVLFLALNKKRINSITSRTAILVTKNFIFSFQRFHAWPSSGRYNGSLHSSPRTRVITDSALASINRKNVYFATN